MLILRNNHTLEQKEFGIASDIRYSGLKKTARKYIGRIRKRWGDSLQKRIDKVDLENRILNTQLNEDRGVDNKDLLKKSICEGRDKYNARTISSRTAYGSNRIPGSSNIGTREVGKDTGFIKSKKMDNILKDNDNIIVHGTSVFNRRKGTSKSARAESHAHEVGHLKNTADKKWYIKRSQKARGRFGNSKEEGNVGIFGRILDNTAIINDEKDASNNALDFMKKNGATEEELNKAKDTLLNKSLKTYKNTAIINRLRPRKDIIQIPSRRNKTTLEDDFDGLKNWKRGGKKK